MIARSLTALAAAAASCLGGCAETSSDGTTNGSSLPVAADEAFRWLTGRFDSKDQAESDPQYFAVQLQTCEVSAPEVGSRVLYVEQAMMTSLGKPYRQRLYALESVADDSTLVDSRVFELAQPQQAVGACDGTEPMAFGSTEVELREGCTVRLAWDEVTASFVGGTTGKDCTSQLNGATYATSHVELRTDRIDTWDRGFDASDVQVWGASKGPYRFVRRTPLED